MDEDSTRPIRVIHYSPLAAQDFAENHDSTAHMWGLDQAEPYSDFLEAAVQESGVMDDSAVP
jgi:hypothetical protein